MCRGRDGSWKLGLRFGRIGTYLAVLDARFIHGPILRMYKWISPLALGGLARCRGSDSAQPSARIAVQIAVQMKAGLCRCGDGPKEEVGYEPAEVLPDLDHGPLLPWFVQGGP